jgi:hypothetical protein
MYKIIAFLLFALIGSSTLLAQSYALEYKSIIDTNKEKNYTIGITYTQIKGLNSPSEDGYNKLVQTLMNAQADSFRVWMKDWESYNKEMGSFYEIGDTALYIDSKMISTLFYEFYYFSGAAHPNNSNFSVNYDLIKNKEIKLGDLFTGSYLKTLSEICIKEISKTKKEYDPEFNSKNDEWLNSGAGPEEKNFKVFNVTKENFVITFPTYQVASYAEGPQTVEIPYSRLKKIINPEGLLGGFVK